MIRRLAKLTLLLACASAAALSIYAFKTDRAVFANYLRRELVDSGGARPITPSEIKALANRPSKATIHVRRLTADRWRQSIAIQVSSMDYEITGPAALNSYYEDNGWPENNPFQHFVDPPLVRGFFRFPLSRDRVTDWDVVPKLPPPDYKPHYTFVRTHDPYRTGWDLELRVPFWIIWTALALPPLCYAGTKGYRRMRRRARRLRRHCERCNYDLRASQQHCPECNHPIPTP